MAIVFSCGPQRGSLFTFAIVSGVSMEPTVSRQVTSSAIEVVQRVPGRRCDRLHRRSKTASPGKVVHRIVTQLPDGNYLTLEGDSKPSPDPVGGPAVVDQRNSCRCFRRCESTVDHPLTDLPCRSLYSLITATVASQQCRADEDQMLRHLLKTSEMRRLRKVVKIARHNDKARGSFWSPKRDGDPRLYLGLRRERFSTSARR